MAGLNTPGAVRLPDRNISMNDWENEPRRAIQQLLDGAERIEGSFEECYRIVYQLVLFKHGDAVYDSLSALFSTHLDGFVNQELAPLSSDDVEDKKEFAETFLRGWKTYIRASGKARDICRYLDSVYCRSCGLPGIYQLARGLFISHVVFATSHPIEGSILEALSELPVDGMEVKEMRDVLDELRRADSTGRLVLAFPNLRDDA